MFKLKTQEAVLLATVLVLAGIRQCLCLVGDSVRWRGVDLMYGLHQGLGGRACRALEVADHQVYELTSHGISGHTLKHLVASFAAWPPLMAIGSAYATTQKQGRIHVRNSDNSPAH